MEACQKYTYNTILQWEMALFIAQAVNCNNLLLCIASTDFKKAIIDAINSHIRDMYMESEVMRWPGYYVSTMRPDMLNIALSASMETKSCNPYVLEGESIHEASILLQKGTFQFFHKSRLIRWIQQYNIYEKIHRLDQGVNLYRLPSYCTRMFSVIV